MEIKKMQVEHLTVEQILQKIKDKEAMVGHGILLLNLKKLNTDKNQFIQDTIKLRRYITYQLLPLFGALIDKLDGRA